MHLALDQAKRALGLTSPNPPVGSVIVRHGEVIGEGYHHKAGLPHAEIEALNHAKAHHPHHLPGATLYVTLEPCSTHGRTGPCTEAIQKAGIQRVVYGAHDPNPHHRGQAQKILTAAGLQVTTGVLEAECQELIRPFAKWVTTGMPYVIAKAGQTLDGFIDRPVGESQWITSEAARAHGRRLRGRSDAILIGAETLRRDNPMLTLRGGGLPGKEQPWRVVLTRSGNLPATAHLFTDEHQHRTRVMRDLPLVEVLRELGKDGVVTVLLEGGGNVLGQAFQHQLVDEAYWYIAPRFCGHGQASLGNTPLPQSIALDDVQIMTLNDNICIHGRPKWPAPSQPAN